MELAEELADQSDEPVLQVTTCDSSQEKASENPDKEDDCDGDAIDVADTVRDEYSYLQREGFTSEIFKIEIKHLTKKVTPVNLKNFIASKNLKPKKVKLLKLNYEVKAYVSFACDEDRNNAVKQLNGVQWKGSTLLAKNAAPKADPLQMKKKMDERDNDEPASKRPRSNDDDSEMTPEEKLKSSVTPLWKIPYEKQIQKKHNDMTDIIRKLGRLIDRNNSDLLQWYIKQKRLYGKGLCCPLEPTIESPVRVKYRNKCEFTIGRSIDGKERVVGFRYGKYRGGCSSVGEPDSCSIVPAHMIKVVKHIQSHVTSSCYDVFEPETSGGHWRMLTVRTTATGQTMAMVEFHPQNLTQDELANVKTSLKEYFVQHGGNDVTSLYFHVNGQKTTASNDLTPYELILGEDGIVETLSGLRFRISPLAFFQVNTAGAEVLYEQVRRLCGAGPETTVLDICCGTGTIGLTMAKSVAKVIGVEMVQSAIDDAKANAKMNGIENVEYRCGKAEDIVPDLMTGLHTDNVVAVLDPPRAGLHFKVVQALRKCESLKTLVYVSCNPNAALTNFIDFCRAESKRVRGAAFVPVKALCVDLFPDTSHCELVVLFERYNPARHLSSNEQKLDSKASETSKASEQNDELS